MVETEQEPESKESQVVDLFFEALMDGDEIQAASALRQLDSLDGFSIVTKCVACLLAWPFLQQGVVDRRLELKKRTKGRPKKVQDGSELDNLGLGEATAFFGLIAAGKAYEAGKALDLLEGLHGVQLKIFADLFDNNPGLPEAFSWRFKFAAEGPGKPVSRLRNAAKDFGWRRVLTDAFANPGKKEAGIHDVMTRTKRPRSTVMDTMTRLEILGPKK
jgi:hypothetical protein